MVLPLLWVIGAAGTAGLAYLAGTQANGDDAQVIVNTVPAPEPSLFTAGNIARGVLLAGVAVAALKVAPKVLGK